MIIAHTINTFAFVSAWAIPTPIKLFALTSVGRSPAPTMSGDSFNVEGYDSADATSNQPLQIDMKGLFGDTVGNVSYTDS